jgi:hypothetical protein
MLRWLALLSIPVIMSVSCGDLGSEPGGNLDFTFAHQAIDGPCPEVAQEAPAPPALDRLELAIYGPNGDEHYTKSVNVQGGVAPKVDGIPEGDDLSLMVAGYEGATLSWSGSASGLSIRAGKATTARIFMTRVNDMSCVNRPLAFPRAFLAAVPMSDGRFLLAGGADRIQPDSCGAGCDLMHATASVDIFDPGTGTIYPTTRMHTPRALATATMLSDGTVLVIGGASRFTTSQANGLPLSISESDLVDSFEIYLPDKKLWIVKPLPEPLIFHSATLLDDGRVLVAGGGTGFGPDQASEKAYLFDPAGESVGDFVNVQSNLSTPRFGHAAVRAPSGKVLLIGGAVYPTASTVEEFDPGTGIFTAKNFTGSPANLFFHDAVIIPLRPDEILVAGGSSFDGDSSLNPPSSESVRILSQISSPDIQSTDGPPMSGAHLMYRMVITASNEVLMAGGFVDLSLTPGQAVDLFDPTGSMQSPTALSVARGGQASLGITGGRALIAGGLGPDGLLGSAELFTSDPQP